MTPTDETVRDGIAGWTDQIRELCRADCAKVGDPPCWQLGTMEPSGAFVVSQHDGSLLYPCEDCASRALIEAAPPVKGELQ